MRISDWSSDVCSSDLYMLANPTQLAVMAARLGSGRAVVPRFLLDKKDTTPPPIGVKPEHLAFIHDAMSQVVNGEGTARSARMNRSEEHTSELQSLMRSSYAVFCLKKKTIPNTTTNLYLP